MAWCLLFCARVGCLSVVAWLPDPDILVCCLAGGCCRWPDLQAGVLMAPDCVMVLSERLQMFRDTEVRNTGPMVW